MVVPMQVYGLPASYAEQTYESVGLSDLQQKRFTSIIARAPSTGLLAVKGEAGPVINQLMQQGRSVRGIDFAKRSSKAFEDFQNPVARVVVLYNVGLEVSVNHTISAKVLRNLLKFYKHQNTLVILETPMTKSQLLSTYDLRVANAITIAADIEEEVWV